MSTNIIELPGAVNIDAMVNAPSLSYREAVVGLSTLAVHGGITTLVDHPDSNPDHLAYESFELAMKVAKTPRLLPSSHEQATYKIADLDKYRTTNMGYYMGVSVEQGLNPDVERAVQIHPLNGLRLKIGSDFTTDEGKEKYKQIFKDWRAITDLPIVIETDPDTLPQVLWASTTVMDPVHISGISTNKELHEIKRQKHMSNADPLNPTLTCSVTMRDLLLPPDRKADGSKQPDEREFLWANLEHIDVIGSDGWEDMEVFWPLMVQQVLRRDITIQQLIDKVSTNPARIMRLKNTEGDRVLMELGQYGAGTPDVPINSHRYFGHLAAGRIIGVEIQGQTMYQMPNSPRY